MERGKSTYPPQRELSDSIEQQVHMWLCQSGYNAEQADDLADDLEGSISGAVESYQQQLKEQT